MYLALSNIGAGGTQDIALSDISNAVLYALFSLTGLVGGCITNSKCNETATIGGANLVSLIVQSWVNASHYFLVRLVTPSTLARCGGKSKSFRLGRYIPTYHGE